MTEPTSVNPGPDPSAAASASYAPYAQLVKMLVPSSGCIAIYDVEGDLIWCSDGFERPDLRELVERLRSQDRPPDDAPSAVEETSTGVAAYTSVLTGQAGDVIGYVLIELGQTHYGPAGASMAPSLLRPVLECLQSHIGLERAVVNAEPSNSHDFDVLLAVDFDDPHGQIGLQKLVDHCVENLGSVAGALVVPEQNLALVSGRGDTESGVAEHLLDRTQKHLLAWAQLNNRPMVVNRVGAGAEIAPYKILSCPVRDPDDRVTGLMALFRAADGDDFGIRDVRILEFMSRKAVSILNSQHDHLTGLINKLIFERRVQEILDSADSDGGYALLYIDIDRLQLINDAFGFQAGDEVIRRLAEVIRSRLTDTDVASRIGGDRFAVFLPGASPERGSEVAERIIGAMSKLGYLNGGDAVPVSVSIGIAGPAAGRQDLQHVLATAELTCKRAKQMGSNRVEACSDSSLASLTRRNELFASASLQHALKNNEFRLEAQPIIGVSEDADKVLGFEVFVRMRDSAGGLVAPNKFVDAAERYGLMPALDRWVVSAAVTALGNFAEYLPDLPLGIGINVSSHSLLGESFPSFVIEELERAGLPAGAFSFELKESAAVHHLGAAERFIEQLEAAGSHVGLDDFGYGLSSLVHLKRLNVRYLKIDGSLVRRVLEDLHVESLVRGLSKAAQTLGVRTVAEHVESEPLVRKLRELEVDFGQGYYFGHPQPLVRVIDEAMKSIAPLPAASS